MKKSTNAKGFKKGMGRRQKGQDMADGLVGRKSLGDISKVGNKKK